VLLLLLLVVVVVVMLVVVVVVWVLPRLQQYQGPVFSLGLLHVLCLVQSPEEQLSGSQQYQCDTAGAACNEPVAQTARVLMIFTVVLLVLMVVVVVRLLLMVVRLLIVVQHLLLQVVVLMVVLVVQCMCGICWTRSERR
jgi:hypothetical protein